MPEWQVFRTSRNKMMFSTLTLVITHVGEPERIEYMRVIVVFVVEVNTPRGRNGGCSLGYESSIGEREVFDGCPHQAH